MGTEWLKKHVGMDYGLMGIVPAVPTVETLNQTHACVAVKEIRPGDGPDSLDLEKVYSEMQCQLWSPKGEARELIRELKLTHTSMSVGDIVKHNEVLYIVADVGFERIN